MLQKNELLTSVADIDDGCTGCGTCAARCSFLQEHGTPADIAAKVSDLPSDQWPDPFHCSLCGLCGAVCPANVRPDNLFLAMRQARVSAGQVDLKPYSPVLTYEKLGSSSLFSYLHLPEGGDTVLFPGCALPASRSATVKQLFLALRESDPRLGIALGCCMKPSHDLGREDFFGDDFGKLLDRLVQAGVKRVVTTCPNCQRIFQEYGGSLESVTAVCLLAESGYVPSAQTGDEVVVHDACPQRYDRETQDAVRTLAERCSMKVGRMATQGAATRCCGEGGLVGFVKPEFAGAWAKDREKAVNGRRVVVSCAGCANHLGRTMDVVHILDELFQSTPSFNLKSPFTYAARLWLKAWFRWNS